MGDLVAKQKGALGNLDNCEKLVDETKSAMKAARRKLKTARQDLAVAAKLEKTAKASQKKGDMVKQNRALKKLRAHQVLVTKTRADVSIRGKLLYKQRRHCV